MKKVEVRKLNKIADLRDAIMVVRNQKSQRCRETVAEGLSLQSVALGASIMLARVECCKVEATDHSLPDHHDCVHDWVCYGSYTYEAEELD